MITVADKDMSTVNSILNILSTDCDLALSDKWDRSDDGFIAMQDCINEIGELLGLEVEVESFEEEED